LRKIPEECVPNFDTLTIIEPDEKLRKLFIETLVSEGFGTKNLPDAMEWHCTAYWDHALSAEQIFRSKKTKKLLEEAIAIPILLRKSVENYQILGNILAKLN